MRDRYGVGTSFNKFSKKRLSPRIQEWVPLYIHVTLADLTESLRKNQVFNNMRNIFLVLHVRWQNFVVELLGFRMIGFGGGMCKL